MNKRFNDAFRNYGTVHGGQHMTVHNRSDGTSTTTSTQNGQTTTVVTDADGNEHITYPDGTTHTRYSNPADVLAAVKRARENR
ncbi:hypothetical protein ACR820_19825 [Streptomyces netropsis]